MLTHARALFPGRAIAALLACALLAQARPGASAAAPGDATSVPAKVPPAPAPVRIPNPNARLYLAWHAPYGEPGASGALTAACGDTTAKDTLYMTFDPGRDSDHFLGLTATLYFWAGSRDSLAAHWRFGSGRRFRGLDVQLNPDSVPGGPRALPDQSIASAVYDWTRGSGKLRMIIATGPTSAQPVRAGTRYLAARLLVPRPPLGEVGCNQPICVEWALSNLSLGPDDSAEVNRGERFVAYNSPGDAVCAPLRRFSAPWQPQPAGGAKRK
jgi:hypothetical protein